MTEYPFYSQLEKRHRAILHWTDRGKRANILYRRDRLRNRAISDVGLQRDLREMCREDTLFFFVLFCWLLEPRKVPRIIPFVPWPHQIPAIKMLDDCWGVSDMIWEKSRGEGATWIVCNRMLKDFLFRPMFQGGIASKSADDVDKDDHMSSVMPKREWQLKRLPEWLKPNMRRVHGDKRLLANLDNGAVITGHAAIEDLGTGGRKTVWLWDEVAKFPRGADRAALDSTAPTSDCRLLVSTYKGTDNEYYRMAKSPGLTPMVILRWEDNPTRNRGMFRIQDYQIVPVDEAKYGIPSGEFVAKWEQYRTELENRRFEFADGKMLSPWFIAECIRPGATPQQIAQEYDRNPEGTEYQFFSAAMVERRKLESSTKPKWRGEIQIDDQYQPRFIVNPNGPLRLWVAFGSDKMPQISNPVVIGCDIAQGTGGDMSSNSVAAVFDSVTGEQICEYVTRRENPTEFADSVMALGNAFRFGQSRAYLNWEHDGATGKLFFARIRDLNYGNIYMRDAADTRGKQKTKRPGTLSQLDKANNLAVLRDYYNKKSIQIKSEQGHDELMMFIYNIDGKVVHARAKTTEDLASRGASHGDRGIAYSMAVLGMKDRPAVSKKVKRDPPPGSMGWRRKKSLTLQRQSAAV